MREKDGLLRAQPLSAIAAAKALMPRMSPRNSTPPDAEANCFAQALESEHVRIGTELGAARFLSAVRDVQAIALVAL
jgi:hypothetical protein